MIGNLLHGAGLLVRVAEHVERVRNVVGEPTPGVGSAESAQKIRLFRVWLDLL